jgi:hypothetical protein
VKPFFDFLLGDTVLCTMLDVSIRIIISRPTKSSRANDLY